MKLPRPSSTRNSLLNAITVHIPIMAILAAAIAWSCSDPRAAPFGVYSLDPDLAIELIASDPEIVTPIGLAVDDDDHLYVLESHTHSPQPGYQGLGHDVIKRGGDQDGDGKPEKWMIYADSIEDGMNLYWAGGKLYLATKNSIESFEDRDDDGTADQRTLLLHMALPADVYDHAGILGIAVSPDGWIYFSRGNTGSQHWRVLGTDGSSVEGYGDGGNVMRSRLDGSAVEIVATGFWNPFDLKFVRDGRLLLTDNDPDSRGPNRLIEVVPGGDYGYQSRYGGSGIHPFLAWNGELPGTLPYAAPLGEAPCALIDAGQANFGKAYAQSILAAVWEENNIVRVDLKASGSSVTGMPEVLIQGDSSFHPVAMVTNSKGQLYVTDWVVRQYPNHGKGRIWRIRTGQEYMSTESRPPQINRFAAVQGGSDQWLERLREGDPFELASLRAHLAVEAPSEFREMLHASEDPHLRLQGLLVERRRDGDLNASLLRRLLRDDQPGIRRMALIYIAEKRRIDLREDLQSVLEDGYVGAALMQTYLATLRHLDPTYLRALDHQQERHARNLPRRLPEGFLTALLQDESLEEVVRAAALPYLPVAERDSSVLLDLLRTAQQPAWQEGLIHCLTDLGGEQVKQIFLAVALDTSYAESVRATALSALLRSGGPFCRQLLPLLSERSDLIAYVATKHLTRCSSDDQIRASVEQALGQHPSSAHLQAVWDFRLGLTENPESDDDWSSAVDGSGHVGRGRVVYQSLVAQCQTCHRIDGWGGLFGPDLSNIGRSKSRAQIINSILRPSLEVAPEWQAWQVTDRYGQVHYGRQIDVLLDKVELMNIEGRFDVFEEPRTFGVADISLMPDGLEQALTVGEFSDLISYLQSLR